MTPTPIARLYEIFGKNAVLLPIKPGEKRPAISAWQKTTFADTQKQDYQLTLEAGSIGVLAGLNISEDTEVPRYLCSIDIDDNKAIAPFIRLNPGLAQTPITRGEKGIKIWINCLVDPDLEKRQFDSFPKNKHNINWLNIDTADPLDDKWGDWLSKGAQGVVWGKHPCGEYYHFVKLNDDGSFEKVSIDSPEIPEVRDVYFREIQWPEDVHQFWLASDWDALTRAYGRPWDFVLSGGGDDGPPTTSIGSICEHFWGGYIALKHQVIYEAEEVDFYHYNPKNGAWEIRNDDEIRGLVSRVLLELSRCPHFRRICYRKPPQGWMPLTKNKLSDMESPKMRGSDKISKIMNFLRAEVSKRKAFLTGTGIVHLQNGMLNLREKKPALNGFSPRYYSRNPIPVPFEGSAKRARRFMQFLKSSLPEEDIDLLQRIGGLILLGRNDPQIMTILSGTAGGGKSTFVKMVQLLIGRPNVVEMRTSQLKERFEMSAYLKKTLLCGVDVPGDFLMKEGADRIKALTGGDWMTAEIKGGKHFIEIDGLFNIIITCNSRLRVRLHADAEAWRRRLRLIRFEQPPVPKEKRIRNFAEFLIENEGPGILNFFIKGAFRVLAGDDIKCSKRQQKVVDDMLDESDSARVFLRNCVRKAEKGETVSISSDDLTEAYVEYCEKVGWDSESSRTFQRQAKDLMLEMFRAKHSNSLKDDEGKSKGGYRGVAWKAEDDEGKDEEVAF